MWLTIPGCQCEYLYDKKPMAPGTMSWPLRDICKQAADRLNMVNTYNCCNINLYENGRQCLGHHDDGEPLFFKGGDKASGTDIISVSLGATRTFAVRSKATGKNFPIELPGGSMLTMEKLFQSNFTHALPQQPSEAQPRINLTFRTIQYPTPQCTHPIHKHLRASCSSPIAKGVADGGGSEGSSH